jgi:hypothetical protein
MRAVAAGERVLHGWKNFKSNPKNFKKFTKNFVGKFFAVNFIYYYYYF